MVLCLTWEVDKIEIANSYIKMLPLPTRGTCNSLQNRRFFFFFGVCHTSEEREKRLTGKGARKITPVLQAPDRLQS